MMASLRIMNYHNMFIVPGHFRGPANLGWSGLQQ